MTNENISKEKRNFYGKFCGIFGIITNLILGIIKLIIGIISNSVSILADASNNISDMLSSFLTIVGFKLSSKKPDKNHPFGYERYEYIFGVLIAVLMIIMGAVFAKESIVKIIYPKDLVVNYITFIVLVVSILLKISQMIVYLHFSKNINSKTLKTTALDTRNDIITTTFILISMIIMKLFNINLDGLFGLIISLFVIFSSYKMLIELLDPIIGIIPSKEKVDKIKKKLLSYDCVLGIHDLVIHSYGQSSEFVTVHVEIDSSLDMINAHDMIDAIENDFRKKYDISLTIHMDPVLLGNKEVDKMKKKVTNTLKKLDKELLVHDFRMIEGEIQTKILFDCVVPFDKNYNEKDLISFLKENIYDKNHNYLYIIEIDRPFS